MAGYVTRDERKEMLRTKVRARLARTLMRTPDNVDLLHLGELLCEVWDEGYYAGSRDYVGTGEEDDVNETMNPYSH